MIPELCSWWLSLSLSCAPPTWCHGAACTTHMHHDRGGVAVALPPCPPSDAPIGLLSHTNFPSKYSSSFLRASLTRSGGSDCPVKPSLKPWLSGSAHATRIHPKQQGGERRSTQVSRHGPRVSQRSCPCKSHLAATDPAKTCEYGHA